jgi:hypothetical protein
MNYIQIVLTISCISVFCLQSEGQLPTGHNKAPIIEVAFASKTTIEQLQAKVAQDLYQTYIVKNVIKGALGAGCVAACYLCHRDYKIVPLAAIKNEIISTPYGWWDTFWNFGTLVCQGVVVNYAQYLLSIKIFHDCSIEWFSQYRTSLGALYEELEALKVDIEYIKQQLMPVTTYQADHYAYSFIHMHNAFVAEVEKLLSYMQYKSHCMQVQHAHLHGDAYIGSYLYQRMQDTAQQLHDIREQYSACSTDEDRVMEIIKMFESIQSLSIELNSCVASFKRLEEQSNV